MTQDPKPLSPPLKFGTEADLETREDGTYFRLDKLAEYQLALDMGASRASVAPILGLSHEQLAKILAVGRREVEAIGPHAVETAEVDTPAHDPGRLYILTRRAEARAELTLVQALYGAAASGNWKAAQTLLALRYPSRWAPVKRNEVGKKGEQKPQQKGLAQETLEQLRREVLGVK